MAERPGKSLEDLHTLPTASLAIRCLTSARFRASVLERQPDLCSRRGQQIRDVHQFRNVVDGAYQSWHRHCYCHLIEKPRLRARQLRRLEYKGHDVHRQRFKMDGCVRNFRREYSRRGYEHLLQCHVRRGGFYQPPYHMVCSHGFRYLPNHGCRAALVLDGSGIVPMPRCADRIQPHYYARGNVWPWHLGSATADHPSRCSGIEFAFSHEIFCRNHARVERSE